MLNHLLVDLGWDADLERTSQDLITEGTYVARVAAVDRASVLLFTHHGERRGHPRSGVPELATGDWVVVESAPEDHLLPIVALIPRRTRLARKEAGKRSVEQTLVANVDTVFVVSALGQDLNPRRIERYLTIAWGGGARPVLVLTKADMCADVDGALSSAAAVAVGTPTHAVSGLTGVGLEELRPYLRRGETIATVGSSGVGKSTLINALCGREAQVVKELGWYGKGRHTTTRRELVPAPGGFFLADTPGLREVGLWAGEEGLEGAFSDIRALAASCRFNDCRHQGEPGCAVRGEVPAERLNSFHKLEREARSLAVRADKAAGAAERRARKRSARSLKKDAY